MKYSSLGLFGFLAFFGFMTANAFAVSVTGAALDAEFKNILVSVTYGGGCGDHKFTLKMGKCTRSFPVHCSAVLTDDTNDHCRALFFRTVVLSLKEYGLDSNYFSDATLRIRGDGDTQSAGVVRLPKVSSQ